MRRIYALIERVAPADATVLIQGETGTGKELVARTLHDESKRADGPYIAVDCGAITGSLIESELFGHARGAFTGAVNERAGALEAANGGTVFFDEIGELPMELQPKLLRCLETRRVRRVGDNHERPVDVRVIAATNQPLALNVNEGSFREDLYYRLAVVELELPPLRSRRDDVPALVRHFYRLYTGEESPPPDLVAGLSTRSWPGNVRELRNIVERSVLLGVQTGSPIERDQSAHHPSAVQAEISLQLPLKEARTAWVEQFEAVYVKMLLEKTGGNVTRSAGLAGISRRSMQRLMARLGLRGQE